MTNHLPTVRDCGRIAQSLRSVAEWIDTYAGHVLAARTPAAGGGRELELDGSGRCPHGVHGGVGCGDCRPDDVRLTSVEAAAQARLHDAKLLERQMELRVHLGRLDDELAAVYQGIGELRSMVDPPKARLGHDGPSTCAELYCDEPAVKGGYCEADYQRRRRYRAAHDGQPPPQLTRAEAEHRKRLAENRKVYVNGPNEGDAA